MITIFVHIPSVVIGVVIGYILVTLIVAFFSRFEPTDFQRGYSDGVTDTERKYENERTEESKQEYED